MRLPVILGLLIACGSSKPATDPPPPATSSMLDCSKVADHVAATVGTQTRSGVTPGAVKSMVSTRCQTDGWSHETKQCLFAIKSVTEGRACATGMTDVQRDAIKAHARQLRSDASTTTDDTSSDWIKHVVED